MSQSHSLGGSRHSQSLTSSTIPTLGLDVATFRQSSLPTLSIITSFWRPWILVACLSKSLFPLLALLIGKWIKVFSVDYRTTASSSPRALAMTNLKTAVSACSRPRDVQVQLALPSLTSLRSLLRSSLLQPWLAVGGRARSAIV